MTTPSLIAESKNVMNWLRVVLHVVATTTILSAIVVMQAKDASGNAIVLVIPFCILLIVNALYAFTAILQATRPTNGDAI